MLGRLGADPSELVDAERSHPLGQAGDERRDLGPEVLDRSQDGLRLLVPRVGCDVRVHVGLEFLECFQNGVVLAQDTVGGLPVGCGDNARLGGADVEFFVGGDQTIDVGVQPFLRIVETSRIERRVDVNDAPPWEGLGGGCGHPSMVWRRARARTVFMRDFFTTPFRPFVHHVLLDSEEV